MKPLGTSRLGLFVILALIASALGFCTPAIASSETVLQPENRAELFSTSPENCAERSTQTPETAPGYYDSLREVASDSSVAPRRTGQGPFGYPSGTTTTARETVEQAVKRIPASEKQVKSIAKRIERELGKGARREFHDLKDKALGDRTMREALEDAISLYEDAGKDVPRWLLDRLN